MRHNACVGHVSRNRDAQVLVGQDGGRATCRGLTQMAKDAHGCGEVVRRGRAVVQVLDVAVDGRAKSQGSYSDQTKHDNALSLCNGA